MGAKAHRRDHLGDASLAALEKLQKGDDYHLTTVKDIFLQPQEPKRWERRQ